MSNKFATGSLEISRSPEVGVKMSFEKFRILIWKNWSIQKRHWKSGTFEVLFPVLLVIVFTWLFKEYARENEDIKSEIRGYYDDPQNYSRCYVRNSQPPMKVVFSPTSPWLESFIFESLDKSVPENHIWELVGVNNSELLDQYLVTASDASILGIEFKDSLLVFDHFFA